MTSPNRLRTYLFSYYYHGDRFSLEVPAYSKDEAAGRVRQMVSAVYDGEVFAEIPANLGWLGKVIVAARNTFAGAR
jgi:hypothetical protein